MNRMVVSTVLFVGHVCFLYGGRESEFRVKDHHRALGFSSMWNPETELPCGTTPGSVHTTVFSSKTIRSLTSMSYAEHRQYSVLPVTRPNLAFRKRRVTLAWNGEWVLMGLAQGEREICGVKMRSVCNLHAPGS